ncbi:MAG: hypothetical protein QOE01_1102, partial [Actinomycetota bacterium]|nr:hypothetical protein [Actinomycetota bacterium]
IPVVGNAPAAGSRVSATLEQVIARGLPPLVSAVSELDPNSLQQPDGRIDLDRIRAARAPAARANRVMASARDELAILPTSHIAGLDARLSAVRTELGHLADGTDALARATQALPPMLGQDGRRRYLVAMENPAESRGTGGLLGAFGVVSADSGRLRLLRTGPNSDLQDEKRLPVDLGPDYRALWGSDPAIWRNSNLSPHLPYASRIWLALWKHQFHERLDGVITIDPVALGYLLGPAGKLRGPDGSTVTGHNAARVIMHDSYERYPSPRQNRQRDQFLLAVGRKVADRLLHGVSNPSAMGQALVRAVDERRLGVYSAHPDEEHDLSGTAIAQQVPVTKGPYLSVVVNNGGANKLDYYLRRRVTYRLDQCTPLGRNSHIGIWLTNAAPAIGLPEYVVGKPLRTDAGVRLPPGSNRLLVYVYATHGARFSGATLDSRPLTVQQVQERGHPVYVFAVDLRPGQTAEGRLDLVEPASTRTPPVVITQPLVRNQETTLSAQPCTS